MAVPALLTASSHPAFAESPFLSQWLTGPRAYICKPQRRPCSDLEQPCAWRPRCLPPCVCPGARPARLSTEVPGPAVGAALLRLPGARWGQRPQVWPGLPRRPPPCCARGCWGSMRRFPVWSAATPQIFELPFLLITLVPTCACFLQCFVGAHNCVELGRTRAAGAAEKPRLWWGQSRRLGCAPLRLSVTQCSRRRG